MAATKYDPADLGERLNALEQINRSSGAQRPAARRSSPLAAFKSARGGKRQNLTEQYHNETNGQFAPIWYGNAQATATE